MANPITWQNINSPNVGAVASLRGQASTDINRGFNALSNVLNQRVGNIQAAEAKANEEQLNATLNAVSSLGSIDVVRQALNNNLVGNLGLSDKNAVQARTALENRLGQLMSRTTQANQFEDAQTLRGERGDINALQLALASGNTGEALQLAQGLSQGGQFADSIAKAIDRSEARKDRQEVRAGRKEDRQYRQEQRANEAALGQRLMEAINARNRNISEAQGVEDINTLATEALPFVGDAPKGTTPQQLSNVMRTIAAYDQADEFNQLKQQARSNNVYQQAISNALQSGQLREQLQSLPKVSSEQFSGADILSELERQNRQPLVTDWNWLPITQNRAQLTAGLQRVIEEVGDSGAVLEAFRNDPEVLDAIVDEGGLGSWFDNIDFEQLTKRAQGFKRKREDTRQQRAELSARLAQLGVKPPKP